ncbi:hypothetical protein NPIL_584371 [Nephila pilipes]|uniref:Uncharacterized protein n=1 Tax=Nephila pilipes TaxID=299642 RepID=A0A8X6PB23_NEPPI|nr:hypothetical protein NPIL_584371 [Nephila pilipes]
MLKSVYQTNLSSTHWYKWKCYAKHSVCFKNHNYLWNVRFVLFHRPLSVVCGEGGAVSGKCLCPAQPNAPFSCRPQGRSDPSLRPFLH